MNKRSLFILAFAALSFSFGGCLKSEGSYTQSTCPLVMGSPSSAEVASLQAYLTSHSITATQDSRGFFYIITSPGAGASPTQNSSVTVKYTGSTEAGGIFDSNLNGAVFNLSQLILGWQMGLPLIKKGGSIKLFLPPSLGYGCNTVGSIPPSSNLIFTIDLIDVQ